MKKTTINNKILAFMLALVMILSLSSFSLFAEDESFEFWDLRNTESFTRLGQTTSDQLLTGRLNGETMTVQRYSRWYAENAIHANQRLSIYVPSNTTENSAVLFIVDNGGWGGTSFSTSTISNNFNLSTSGNNPSNIALALDRGMIIVHCGHRGRNAIANPFIAGEYIHHSPVQVSDAKAGLRFLRYNARPGGLLEGKFNPFLVFVTGSSGGGGLTAVLAASGNSPDYYDSLYEMGAAGIDNTGDIYSSSVSDAFAGAIAYCPIIDIPMGGQQYEWSFNMTRTTRAANSNNNGNNAPYAVNDTLQASAWYANDFVSYFNGLGLKDESGILLTATYATPEELYDAAYLASNPASGVTGGNFKDAIRRLLEKGANKAIQEWASGTNTISNADSVANLNTFNSWLKINGAAPVAGIPAASDIATIDDLETYMNAMSIQHAVYVWPEHHSLFGAQKTYSYSPASEWYWDVHEPAKGASARVGKGLPWNSPEAAAFGGVYPDWKTYIQTNEGHILALQMKMNSPIPYLAGAEKISYLQDAGVFGNGDVEPAPYWYVRHGMNDPHAGFSVEAMQYYCLLNNDAVDNDFLNFNFSWRKGHGGNYDNPEAFAWLDEVVYADAHKVVAADASANVTKLNGNKNNLTITVFEYLKNGETVITPITVSIDNNAAGFYEVGPYKVYVDTKGNDQIRACYIVQ